MSDTKENENLHNEMPVDEQANEHSEGNSSLPIDEHTVDETTTMLKELAEQKEKFLRLLAEFENYKRRTAKERIELLKVAGQDVIKDLLPALDDIDRAERVVHDAKDAEAVKQGLRLISEKVKNILRSKGLESVVKAGDAFDTETMEAITEIEAGKDMKGMVVEVLEKGYTLNEKIIRYAKVVVGK